MTPARPGQTGTIETKAADARAAAAALLRLVLRQKQPLDDALDPALTGLEDRDRRFARAIATTTLRRLGQIDARIDRCLDRPLPKSAAPARDALRIGAAQLLYMDVPAHAAVDGSVALLPASSKFRGLTNAVLRRIAREGTGDDGEPISAAMPDWLWQSWAAAYGDAEAAAIVAAQLNEPPIDITVKAEGAEWAKRLDGNLLPTGSIRRRGAGGIQELPGYADGAWWVQDAAAALPARLLGAGPEQTVIDLCAAPGGKTAQLAATGASVIAVDRASSRLARLRQNLERLGLQAETVAADAAAWRPDNAADAVLLDAPCSATGTIRRHPDVAWLKTPGDVEKLAGVQSRLLRAAVDMVKPGGLLVYCVCSLQPEEGPQQIEALLNKGAPVEREPTSADDVGNLTDLITPAGDLRTLPSHLADIGGMDGFYACRLRRL